MQARHLGDAAHSRGGADPPGLGEGASQVGLLGEELPRSVSHPARFDDDDLGVSVEQVRQDDIVVDQPREPGLHTVEDQTLGEPFPLLPAPGLATHELRRSGPDGGVGHQFPSGEDLHLGQRGRRPLVGDRELAQAIDFVAPQVDAHGRLGGRREDVDDRAPQGDLAPMLDLVLTVIPGVDQPSDQVVRVADVADTDDDRLHLVGAGAEALQQGSDR